MEAKTQRAGFHTVTPYLMSPEVDDLVDFIHKAFDGVETFRTIGEAGGQHVEVRIGDSMVMIGGASGGASMPAMIHLYVDDVDAVYQAALDRDARYTRRRRPARRRTRPLRQPMVDGDPCGGWIYRILFYHPHPCPASHVRQSASSWSRDLP